MTKELTEQQIRDAFERHKAKGDIQDMASLYDFSEGYRAGRGIMSEKINMTPLHSPGQIKKGDLLIFSHKGKPKAFKAKVILNPGLASEEVIINKKKNLYFIVNMAINGDSWAQDVHIVELHEHPEPLEAKGDE